MIGCEYPTEEERAEAYKQWVETGTVPIDYLRKETGHFWSNAPGFECPCRSETT